MNGENVLPLPPSNCSTQISNDKMPRKYNHVIRYLESWFEDLEDPVKEFSAADKWAVIVALRDCQVTNSLDPLHALPVEIRRGLSMVTLGEQLMAVLDRADSYRRRGSYVAKAAQQASKPSDAMRAGEREQQQAAKEAKDAKQQASLQAEMQAWDAANPLELYELQCIAAAKGDADLRAKLPEWAETAERVAGRKNLSPRLKKALSGAGKGEK